MHMDKFKNKKIKELHMDTYINEPYMLLSRVIDKNVSHLLQDDRVVLRRKDSTVLMNVPLNDIQNYTAREFADSHYQVLFNVHNVQYKVLAIV